MDSNPRDKVKSFALRQKVKSKAETFDEIVRCARGEMKSVLHPAKRDFTAAGDFTRAADFTRPQGRISLKKARRSVLFSWWSIGDSNP
ncbi:MAG: hypothetical protein IJR17_06880, partial [Clostridia bacterium]|nr:hypothetical protein [Clostridia bacterium]